MSGIRNFQRPEEVAKQLDVSPEVLLSWRKIGMPVVKISKYIFIPITRFTKWMESLIEPEEKPKKEEKK